MMAIIYAVITLAILLMNVVLSDGYDLNVITSRRRCYSDQQPNCNEEFTEVYKNLSLSVTNSTEADTWFWLFTRQNPESPENLHKCGGKLPPGTHFNPMKRLIVILNPFIVGICDVAVYREWKNQFLQREDCNVLMVDSSWGNQVDYETAILNSHIASKQTFVVLRNIQNRTGLILENVYLIGHSFGAHMAGFIGALFSGKIGRITGIDPAGPGFSKKTPLINRLDPSDAEFVDVWHCNRGKCLPYLGIDYDAGDINFYINGGHHQYMCYEQSFKSVLQGDFIYGLGTLLYPMTCYHAICAYFYKVTINPDDCSFVARTCNSYKEFKLGYCDTCGREGVQCIIMGYDTDKYFNKSSSFPQRYYIDTGVLCPYCGKSLMELQG